MCWKEQAVVHYSTRRKKTKEKASHHRSMHISSILLFHREGDALKHLKVPCVTVTGAVTGVLFVNGVELRLENFSVLLSSQGSENREEKEVKRKVGKT